MDFEKRKQNTITKKDRSKKGIIDTQIKSLVDKINSKNEYYTTSSCAGRITILELPDPKKKYLSKWQFISHEEVNYSELRNSLNSIPPNDLWFKMESAIIHVCCKTLDDAVKLLNMAISAGFKHSGILSISKRIIVEIYGSEKIETIISKEGKILVTDDYLKALILSANEKLKETRKRIKKLYSILKCLDNHGNHNSQNDQECQC